MANGFIDSASTYEVIMALARQSPANSYATEWGQALAVTALLIGTDNLGLSPSPLSEGAASGPFGVGISGLSGALRRVHVDDVSARIALERTKRWGDRNIEKLQRLLSSITNSDTSVIRGNGSDWLDIHIKYEWVEHCTRLGALFDQVFNPQLAKILGIPHAELSRIWQETSDPKVVQKLAENRPDSDAFRIIRDAYIASALLRGRYHHHVAEQSSLQILSHPIRDSISPRTLTSQTTTIQTTPVCLCSCGMDSKARITPKP